MPGENTPNKRFRFENLDSIRTLAFFSTFLAHAFYAETPEVLHSKAFDYATRFREIFSFGVPIFFVLSGFLITYLMLRERSVVGKFSVKDFYVRRVLRIWPVFFVVLFIGFVAFPIVRDVVLHDPVTETANWLYYVTFLSNFDQIAQSTLPIGVGLGPTWSVSIEEQFYLFWPLLFLLFNGKKFIYAIVMVMASALVFTSLFELSSKHTVFSMIYLGTGALFAYLAFYHEAFIQRITRVNGAIFLLSLAVLFLLMYLSTQANYGIFFIFLIALNIGYIIVFQCYAQRMQLQRIPFLERTGKYTYGLYLYHVVSNFVIYTLLSKILHVEESIWTVVVIAPVLSLALSLVVSYLSYTYFERFFLHLKEKFSPTARR